MFCEKYHLEIPPFATVCPHCGRPECITRAKERVIEDRRETTLAIAPPGDFIISSGFPNFDALNGDNFSTGDVEVVIGRPGANKSTFAMQFADHVGRTGIKSLFASLEMDERKIYDYKARCRLENGAVDYLYDLTLSDLLAKVRTQRYQFLVIDSLQSLGDGSLIPPTLEKQRANIRAIISTAQKFRVAVLAVSQVNKAGDIAGAYKVVHDVTACLDMARGENSEVVVSVHENKSRLSGDSNRRAIFRNGPHGLVAISEVETGYLLRHHTPTSSGAAFPYCDATGGVTTEELSLVKNIEKDQLLIVGKSQQATAFLSGVLLNMVPGISLNWVVRPTTEKRLGQYADLAICVGIIARHLQKQVPVTSAFMAAVDAEGMLVHLPGMDSLSERAIGQGYATIYGPEPIGSEVAKWIPCSSVMDVIHRLGWLELS